MPDRPSTFRTGSSLALPEVLRSLGCDPSGVFREAGVDAALYAHPENRISVGDLGRLLASAEQITGRSDIGLLVIEGTGADGLGIVQEVVAEGPDLNTALKNLVRLLQHNTLAGYPVLSVSGDTASLKFELRDSDFPGSEYVLDGATGIILRVIQRCCGAAWRPRAVHLSRRAPDSPRAFDAFFGAPVAFSAADDAILFPAQWLNHLVPRERRRRHAQRLEIAAAPVSEQVRRQVAMRLGLGTMTAEAIAEATGSSRRQLFRRLAAEGTTFQRIVDDFRYSRARHMLMSGDAPLLQVALALGFPEQSSFCRAFHRWSGSPPGDWRMRH